jgi:hypothetical protein
MKRFITTFLMTALLAMAIPALSGTAIGQTRYYRSSRVNRTYYDTQQPNVYDRHRKAVNIGVATGIGALLGGLLGGKKGALIGAAAGVAGGAIVTAKQSPRNGYRYRRY